MAIIDKINIRGNQYDLRDNDAQAAIAPLYSTSATYAVGDYVMHDGAYYVCKTAIATPESWTAGHWMQTNVGAEAGGLNSAITQIAEYSDYANLFDKSAVLTDKTLQVGSGKTINDVVDSTGSCVSGIIEIEPSTYYVGNSAFYGDNTAKIYGYNSLGAYNGTISVSEIDGKYVYLTSAIDKYVRFRYNPATLSENQYMLVKGTTLPAEYVPYGKYLSGGELYDIKTELTAEVNAVDNKADSLKIRDVLYKFPNTIDDSAIQQYGYIDENTGEVVTNQSFTTFWYSDYCELIGGYQYYYNGIYPGHIAFYDADKAYISGVASNLPNPFTAPANAKYVRWTTVSSTITAAKKAWFNIINEAPDSTNVKYAFDKNTALMVDVDNPCDYTGKEITIFNSMICIGDSITAGTFNHNEGGTMQYLTDEKYSYPTYLTKLCGVTTENIGVGGYTSVEWWNTRQHRITSGYDCAIINLGINDALEGVSSADTTTALENIINALRTANSNIAIFLATVVPAYADGNSIYDAVNNTIKTVATTNNCYLIDLSTYSHTRAGTVSEAGHLTAWGYYQLAKDYISAISYIMSKNRTAFKFVQFIGTEYSYTP